MSQCKFSWNIIKIVKNNDISNWCEQAIWLNLDNWNETIFIKWSYKNNDLDCNIKKNINYLDNIPKIWDNFSWIFEEKNYFNRKYIKLINYWKNIYNESSLDLCKTNIEETYIGQSCIANWKIKKFFTSKSDCWEIIEMRLNDGEKDYIISWTIKWEWIWWYTDWTNNNEITYSCAAKKYTFDSNPNYKVWDELYVVADYYNRIVWVWKDYYNQNIDNYSCYKYWWPVFSWDDSKWFDSCKLKWNVDKIKYIKSNESWNETCSFDIELQVSNGNWKYFLSSNDDVYFEKWYWSVCWYKSYYSFPFIKNDWYWKQTVSYLPKENTEAYFIVNSESNQIIWYWKDDYSNSEYEDCKIQEDKQDYNLTWWLTNNEIIWKKIDTILNVAKTMYPNKTFTIETNSETNTKKIKIERKPVEIKKISENKQVKLKQEIVLNNWIEIKALSWIEKENTINLYNWTIENNDLKLSKEYFLYWWFIVLFIIWVLIYKKFKKYKTRDLNL